MEFTTFKDIVYTRPDLDAEAEAARACIEGMKNAKTFEEQLALYKAHEDRTVQWRTMAQVAHIRNTVNTEDEFYEAEQRYFNSKTPALGLLNKEMGEIILACPWKEQWTAVYGDLFLKDLEISAKLTGPAIIEDTIREADLRIEYSKASASASCEFRGEKCNFYGLLKHMQSTDREERREAMKAWGDLYESVSGKLDAVYDEMVTLRKGIAQKMGFDSYIDYQYLSRGRYDYTAKDVENFRKQVREVIVPVCQALRDAQQARLGIDSLNYYDESLIYPEGNPVPQGTKDELVAKAQAMYRAMSRETGEYFDFMVSHDMFDLETRQGKRAGGYCTFLPGLKSPFIFSNFNGTSADVDVLTHEAGHAFAAYTAAKDIPSLSMVFSTSEIAEIHSMTMEHWAYPYMEGFFGEKAAKYRYAHLMDAIMTIPYMCAVDEFQHRVFAGEAHDAASRRAVWHELEETYMPWRKYDGHAFLEEGGFWMQKQHIFLFPFYYIDYALAQICAFTYYARSKADHDGTWADYYRLCCCGGRFGYFDTLKYANLPNPFEDGTVQAAIEALKPELGL